MQTCCQTQIQLLQHWKDTNKMRLKMNKFGLETESKSTSQQTHNWKKWRLTDHNGAFGLKVKEAVKLTDNMSLNLTDSDSAGQGGLHHFYFISRMLGKSEQMPAAVWEWSQTSLKSTDVKTSCGRSYNRYIWNLFIYSNITLCFVYRVYRQSAFRAGAARARRLENGIQSLQALWC